MERKKAIELMNKLIREFEKDNIKSSLYLSKDNQIWDNNPNWCDETDWFIIITDEKSDVRNIEKVVLKGLPKKVFPVNNQRLKPISPSCVDFYEYGDYEYFDPS